MGESREGLLGLNFELTLYILNITEDVN